jgi:hypothetical protein
MAKLASVIPSENCWGVAAHLRRSDFEEFFTTTEHADEIKAYWDKRLGPE